jgi:hypothetical protein
MKLDMKNNAPEIAQQIRGVKLKLERLDWISILPNGSNNKPRHCKYVIESCSVLLIRVYLKMKKLSSLINSSMISKLNFSSSEQTKDYKD